MVTLHMVEDVLLNMWAQPSVAFIGVRKSVRHRSEEEVFRRFAASRLGARLLGQRARAVLASGVPAQISLRTLTTTPVPTKIANASCCDDASIAT